ncbi:MAG: hypothetical protein NT023_19945 [Armatimonadetes bacterium]|nr:hypothetical protein [Armatimonadota bacterium]
MKGLLLLLSLYCLALTLYNFYVRRRLETAQRIVEAERRRRNESETPSGKRKR